MTPLEKDKIQGNILRGYTFGHAVHLFFTIENVPGTRRFLRSLEVTSAKPWPKDEAGKTRAPERALNLGLTYEGLSLLRESSDMAASFPAFAHGMLARASMLGDSELLDNPKEPEDAELVQKVRQRWHAIHLWVGLYADDKRRLRQLADQLKKSARDALGLVYELGADAILKGDKPYEHFGFQDNISNPLIEGAYEAREESEALNLGRGKIEQKGPHARIAPIRAGEFVLGYENESGNSGPRGELRGFVKDGTFAVLRQLEQDVAGFRRYVSETATKYGRNDEEVCGWIVGRTRLGTPLAKPDTDCTLNNFGYADDPGGARCPVGAHVRRAYPRDASGVVDGSHRIVRRGMPYGAPLPDDASDNGDEKRGLLFIAINADIEQQFEFIQTKWIHGSVGLASKEDRDPLVGAHDGTGTMVVQGDPETCRPPLLVNGLPRFVHCRGGAYFFMPSLEALSMLSEDEPERSTQGGSERTVVPPRRRGSKHADKREKGGVLASLQRALSPVTRPTEESLENLKIGALSAFGLLRGLTSATGRRAVLSFVVTLPRRIELSGLAIRQFTAVLPLAGKVDADLRATLSDIDQQLAFDQEHGQRTSLFSTIAGLHSARIMLLEDPPRARTSVSAAGARVMRVDEPQPEPADVSASLLLNLVFDGSLDDVLTALLEDGEELRSVLAGCAGFPRGQGLQSALLYLKRARLRGGYFFSDVPDASRREIDGAAELWQAFQTFHGEHQTKLEDGQGAALREAFAAFCRQHRLERVPLSERFERPLHDEERWVRRALDLMQRGQERDERRSRRTNPDAARVRAVHVKHHGCLEAKFCVREALPKHFVRGIFTPGATYDALIRLSNSSHRAQADAARDARGMAIKLLEVDARAERAFRAEFPQGVPELDGMRTQDFVLLSSPTFFARDIRDFAIMSSLMNADADSRAEWLGRLAVYFLRRPREAAILLRALRQGANHPLDLTYHSATPYLLGSELAVKYSVRPRLFGKKSFCRGEPDRADPHYLRHVLQESLRQKDGEPIELEFCLHVSPDRQLPIEDAREDWEKFGAEPYPVATIVIEPQNFSTDDHMERCERLVFNPWNALQAHKPLGSLNRARLALYGASAQARHTAQPSLEPPLPPFGPRTSNGGPPRSPTPEGPGRVPTPQARKS